MSTTLAIIGSIATAAGVGLLLWSTIASGRETRAGFTAATAERGELRTEVGAVRTEVGAVRTEVGELRTEVGAVRTDIGTILQRLSAPTEAAAETTPTEAAAEPYGVARRALDRLAHNR